MGLRWKRIVLFVTVVSAGISLPVYAGFKNTNTASFSSTSRFGLGAFGAVRNSADNVQYLECETASSPGVASSGFCEGQDASGNSGFCSTSDANLLAEIRSIGADDFVYFTWDASGHCTTIQVEHTSYTPPKSL